MAVINEFSSGITGSGVNGITKGPDGNLWFTESRAQKIGRITTAGAITEFTPGLSQQAAGITTGPDGNLWFSEAAGLKVGRLTTGGSLTEFPAVTTATSGVVSPATATVGPDGNLWFTTADGPGSTSAVIRSTSTGTVTVFTAGITQGSGVLGITAGPDGNLWFTEFNNRIGRITPTGTVTEFPALGNPFTIVAGPDGNLWATELNGPPILRINPADGSITTFANNLAGTGPQGITVGADGSLWFAESAGNKIGRIDPKTGQVAEFPVPSAGGVPSGIALGPDNNIWFTEFAGNRIGRLNTSAAIVPGAVAVAAVEGQAFSGEVATFINGNPATSLSDYAATIDWGDGTAGILTRDAAGTFHVSGDHTYAEEGSYSATVSIRNISTDTTVQQVAPATVLDAPLAARAVPITATEGVALSAVPVVTFQDANPRATLADFPAANISINWGDGTPASAGQVAFDGADGFTVSGRHVYAIPLANGVPGSLTITTTIRDAGGATATVSSPATINAVSNSVIGPLNLSGQLNPSSDTGQSRTDAITRVNQPDFFGNAQPGSIVILSAQPTGGGPPVQIARTVADASGSWTATSDLVADGAYIITATAADSFGNPQGTTTILPASHSLVIDTVGPKVTAVHFDRTTGRVDITFQDDRSGMAQASVTNAANYSLTGPHTRRGTFLVNVISTTPGGPASPEPVALTINDGRTIRGGIFTFTARSGGVRDVAGNALDGEFYGSFPSGNKVPGGDFVAGLTTFHNRVFAAGTLIGHASPVGPPPAPSTGATFVATANPNLLFGTSNRPVTKASKVHPKRVNVHLAAHDRALSQLSGSSRPR